MKDCWQLVKLNEVCNIINGRNQKLVESPDGEYPIYGSGGIMGYATDYLCEAGATIIGRKGSINNPIYVETRFWNVDTAFGLLPKPCMNSRLFHYFCLSFDFTKMNKGTTIPSLVKNDLLQIDVPYNPSISEQQRIVGILDAEFEKIDALKANAEKNLQNAKDLFQAALKKELEPHHNWKQVLLKDIAIVRVGPFGSSLHKKDYICGGTPLINPIHMKDGIIEASTDFSVNDEKLKELSSYVLYEGDIVFARRGDIGRCALITNKENGYLCGTGSLFVRFKKQINSMFMISLLNSPFVRNQLIERASGATMLNINSTAVENIVLFLPSIEEQNAFLNIFHNLKNKCEYLKDNYTQTIALCDDLKQALLRKAFSGEL